MLIGEDITPNQPELGVREGKCIMFVELFSQLRNRHSPTIHLHVSASAVLLRGEEPIVEFQWVHPTSGMLVLNLMDQLLGDAQMIKMHQRLPQITENPA
jgi:hypothetical protein